MTRTQKHPAGPLVVLDPVEKGQVSVLHNLIELYAHDFSEYVPLEIEANGRFELPLDDKWWTSENHFPFFIRWHGKLSGFALVSKGSRLTGATDVMDVEEFFVIRGARGKGVGTTAAHALFTSFPGMWEMRVKPANLPALKFWARVSEGWVGRPIASVPVSAEGVDWEVFRLTPACG